MYLGREDRKTRHSIRLIIPNLIPDTARRLYPLVTRRGTLFCDILHSKPTWPLGKTVCLTNAVYDFWNATLLHFKIIDICFWLSLRSENLTIFSTISCRIFVGMITDLVWDGDLHIATTHSWMWSTQMRHTALGQLEKPTLPKKGQTGTEQKLSSTNNYRSECREKSFIYGQGGTWN